MKLNPLRSIACHAHALLFTYMARAGLIAFDLDPEEIRKTLKSIGDEVRTVGEKALAQAKATGDMSLEMKAKVDELLVKNVEAQARMLEVEQKLARTGADQAPVARKSAGQQVVEDESFKAFVTNRVRGTISVQIKAQAPGPASTLMSADLPEGVLMPDRQPGILPLLRPRLFMRELISPGRTTAPAISYVRQTGFTNAASAVSEGARKPESTISFDVVISQVATLAHIFKAPKQLLDDFAALQSTVDDEMRYGLKQVEETQLLYGVGTGINLHGIVPQASQFMPAFTPAFLTRIDELRLAMLQATLALLPASGIVLHPTDWAAIELTKDGLGGYIWANPQALGVKTLWGLPVVDTMAIDPGDFLTGGFQGGAQIFDREDINVVVATQNEDDFVRNMITIRCEERLALAVKRPEAFISGTFTPGTGAPPQ